MSARSTSFSRAGSRLGAVVALAVLATIGAGGASARLAHAQDVTWTAEAVPPEPNEKEKNPPPSVKVKVVGEVAPKQEELANYKLTQTDAKPKLGGVKPTRVIPFHKGADSLAIVVLVEGHEYYFGNDKYKEPPKPNPDGSIEVVAITGGVYETIKLALDAPGGDSPDEIPTTISRAGPPGSKGALLVYGTGVDVRQPMGNLADLTGDKLGEQERQKNNVTRDLMAGLNEAKAQLERTSASRKVLFVISDGVDPTAQPDDFKALKKQFDAAKIDVYPLSLQSVSEYIGDAKPVQQQGVQNLKSLGPAKTTKDAKELQNQIANIVTNEINNRYTLYFPGLLVDAKTKLKTGFQWDEKEHELQLTKGEDDYGTRTVLMAPKFGSKPGKSLWWLWLAIPGGLLAIVAAVLLLGGKKQPAPPPVVQAPAPAPMPEAPRPMAPVPGGGNKTMAINLSTGDGIPVVGWLVPINGPQQFKTYKLLAGITKIGNVQGAHIFFDDAFMSAEHAHIVMTPNGFTLMDNNATNGTFVNERRLSGKHELVDNDMVMFGKTSCKFKTIVGLG